MLVTFLVFLSNSLIFFFRLGSCSFYCSHLRASGSMAWSLVGASLVMHFDLFLFSFFKIAVIRRTGMIWSGFLHARASAHLVSHPSNIFPTLIPISISGQWGLAPCALSLYFGPAASAASAFLLIICLLLVCISYHLVWVLSSCCPAYIRVFMNRLCGDGDG